ncbi:MAG: SBBP repeat-containing protein, partial [Terriglobia bacterium]
MGVTRATLGLLAALTLLGLALVAQSAFSPLNAPINSAAPVTKRTAVDVREPAQRQVTAAYGKLPLSFEVNQGQTDAQVKFLSRGQGYTLFLTATEAVLALRSPKLEKPKTKLTRVASSASSAPSPSVILSASEGPASASSTVLRMKLVGANPAPRVTGLDPLPGKSNYFLGNDPSKWRTNVTHYARVRYEEVYPGIDLVYYGTNQSKRSGDPARPELGGRVSSAGRQLEYDFIVAPGADPGAIRLRFEGADKLTLDAEGNLILHVPGGNVALQAPLIYQKISSARELVKGGYVLLTDNQVGFGVYRYDVERSLIIDPILGYSTYLGGGNTDRGVAIAVDAAGNAYVTGPTFSTNFPTTVGAFDTTCGTDGLCDASPRGDIFVAKFDPTGSSLVYSTYLGGSGLTEESSGIAVDTSGNAYVTGFTESDDFPITMGVVQSTREGLEDAFVVQLNPAGSALNYATYLGGAGDDEGNAIAVDSLGNAHITGSTLSSNFPITAGALDISCGSDSLCGGGADAFVTKLNAAGSMTLYSTYLGGAGTDEGLGIAVDAAGNAYVTGNTRSTDFPTANAFQDVCKTVPPGSCRDAFVTKLNGAGNALVYSTYLGGSADLNETGFAIAVDAVGNAYVAGRTGSTDFPTTPGAFQTTNGSSTCLAGSLPCFDAFIVKFNAMGDSLVYSTLLGGGDRDEARSIALDAGGNAHVTGLALSTDFPLAASLQADPGDNNFDAVVTQLNVDGTALVLSSYLGGNGSDAGGGIALDPTGSAYIAGVTTSTDFPTTAGVLQSASAGGFDAFVTKIAVLTL